MTDIKNIIVNGVEKGLEFLKKPFGLFRNFLSNLVGTKPIFGVEWMNFTNILLVAAGFGLAYLLFKNKRRMRWLFVLALGALFSSLLLFL